jgi:hypothetical protein
MLLDLHVLLVWLLGSLLILRLTLRLLLLCGCVG